MRYRLGGLNAAKDGAAQSSFAAHTWLASPNVLEGPRP